MTLDLTFTALYRGEEEEESDDDMGFGVFDDYIERKANNKFLQSEESPQYSPISPSLETEETTLSLSKKELERSRSKGIVKSVSVNV